MSEKDKRCYDTIENELVNDHVREFRDCEGPSNNVQCCFISIDTHNREFRYCEGPEYDVKDRERERERKREGDRNFFTDASKEVGAEQRGRS